jgi:hypothetical protein
MDTLSRFEPRRKPRLSEAAFTLNEYIIGYSNVTGGGDQLQDASRWTENNNSRVTEILRLSPEEQVPFGTRPDPHMRR